MDATDNKVLGKKFTKAITELMSEPIITTCLKFAETTDNKDPPHISSDVKNDDCDTLRNSHYIKIADNAILVSSIVEGGKSLMENISKHTNLVAMDYDRTFSKLYVADSHGKIVLNTTQNILTFGRYETNTICIAKDNCGMGGVRSMILVMREKENNKTILIIIDPWFSSNVYTALVSTDGKEHAKSTSDCQTFAGHKIVVADISKKPVKITFVNDNSEDFPTVFEVMGTYTIGVSSEK